MIKKLQRKFTIIMACMLLAVFVVVFFTLNALMWTKNAQKIERHLQTVADYDGFGFLSKDPSENTGFTTIFYVKLDHDEAIIEGNYDMIGGMTPERAQECASKARQQNSVRGNIGYYTYLMEPKDYGRIIVFAEGGAVIEMLQDLVQTSVSVAAVTCVLLLALSALLARWAVQPVREAWGKQRQFISDASHELKTPLTIISANADVLEHDIGQNKQLFSIRDQIARMNGLIRDMLALAKTDEGAQTVMPVEFDLSSAALNTVLEFEVSAFEAGKNLSYDIAEHIRCIGDEQQIRQVIGILVDNAIVHSAPNGDIKVTLAKDGDKRVLSVYNTGEGIKEADRARIFERFYRSDESRSRETGGYGLGLSIAQSIIERHGGKISVTGTEGEWVQFTIRL